VVGVGRASSSKKVQRAVRAAASSRGVSERRELGFPLTLLAIVALGVVLVGFAKANQAEAAHPTLRDHWHNAYAVYDCDHVLPPFQSQYDPLGIHSHQDGLIHIHPFSSSVTGDGARLGVFFETMGGAITDSSVSGPEIGELTEGSDCNGEPTVLQVARFDVDKLDQGPLEVVTENLADVTFEADRQAFTIALVPLGADIPPPPDDRLEALAQATGHRISTGPVTDFDPNSLFGNGTDTDSGTDTGSGTDSDSGSGADTGSGTGTDSSGG